MNYAHYGFNEQRLEKRERLLAEGETPFPYSYTRTQRVEEIVAAVDEAETAGGPIDMQVRTSGRLWARREMGRARFFDLRDGDAKIQLYCTLRNFSEQAWEHLSLLDAGDIVGVEGPVFRTRTGELSINAAELTVLAKAVVPVPIGKEAGERVYYRGADPEIRYRERYLHWLLDRGDRERVYQRGRIVSSLRRRLEEEDFLEVSTPTITPVYGGAEARPFVTSVWALGRREAYLRISPELHLKRYIVAGFERVYTICQNFRNEGMDASHNPEFTMLEWYEALTDYTFQMERFERLVAAVCEEACGSTRVTYQGIELDFAPPWRRLTMLEALRDYAGVDAATLAAEDLRAELERREVECAEDMTWGRAVAALFEATCEQHLVQPTFVLDHPLEISPLARVHRGNGRLAERFEVFVCGMELGNAYSELADPVEQLQRFVAQHSARRTDGDWIDHPLDADFVKAVGCGMPPTGGVGLGVDRLVMLLTDAASIRDVIGFPMVKARDPGMGEGDLLETE